MSLVSLRHGRAAHTASRAGRPWEGGGAVIGLRRHAVGVAAGLSLPVAVLDTCATETVVGSQRP